MVDREKEQGISLVARKMINQLLLLCTQAPALSIIGEDMLLYEELSMNSIHHLVKRSKLSPQGEREKHYLFK